MGVHEQHEGQTKLTKVTKVMNEVHERHKEHTNATKVMNGVQEEERNTAEAHEASRERPRRVVSLRGLAGECGFSGSWEDAALFVHLFQAG